MNKLYIVSRILLIDGILLIITAFIHLFTTPIIDKWFAQDVNVETISSLTPSALVNQLVGIILIPFGVSTLYCAMGVRVGQHFVRMIVMINAITIIIIPLMILILMGPQYFDSMLILFSDIILVIIGVTMLVFVLFL